MILCIETATDVCSVALSHEGNLTAVMEGEQGRSHATGLTPLIEKLLKEASITFNDISAIAVSKGPGSYTGLRIGVSVSKGIAFSLAKPLIGIGTLDAMLNGFLQESRSDIPDNSLFCPMIDARRMEVYNAVYDSTGKMVREISARVIEKNSFDDLLHDHCIYFFGNGAMKCRELIDNPHAVFIDNFALSASFLAKPAFIAFQEKRFEDVAYFEPYYLKDFIATVSKKQVLTSKKQ